MDFLTSSHIHLDGAGQMSFVVLVDLCAACQTVEHLTSRKLEKWLGLCQTIPD